MAKDYKWMLQPYSGRGSRHKCPHCGKAGAFTRYILTADYQRDRSITYAGEEYGMCNHTSNCGYNQYPGTDVKSSVSIPPKPEAPKYFYDRMAVTTYRTLWQDSVLIKYLATKIDMETLDNACQLYAIGRLREARICTDFDKKEYKTFYDGTIFWQIDDQGQIHRGKVMFYKPDGHRAKIDDKRGAITMMWQVFRRNRDNEPDMCYFGQHLIKKCPDKPIALVESEKTALIATCYMPSFNWMACGSINNFNAERLSFIQRSRTPVVVFPDYDGFQQWENKIEEIRPFFPNNVIVLNKSIIKHGEGKQDIADLLLE